MTARSAKAMGWNAQFVAQTADELVDALVENPVPAPLLHIGGQHTRGDVADRLSACGMPTTHIAVYEQRLQPLTPEAIALLSGEERVLVPLFSPRTSAHFASIAPSLERITVLALSEAVALPLPDRVKTSAIVADAPTGDAMKKALHAAVYPSPMG
jgi:uroporphyrinogen-III synthase